MDPHKRVGVIIMVASAAVAATLILISEGACEPDSRAAQATLGWVRYCLDLQFFQQRSPSSYLIDIPTKSVVSG